MNVKCKVFKYILDLHWIALLLTLLLTLIEEEWRANCSTAVFIKSGHPQGAFHWRWPRNQENLHQPAIMKGEYNTKGIQKITLDALPPFFFFFPLAAGACTCSTGACDLLEFWNPLLPCVRMRMKSSANLSVATDVPSRWVKCERKSVGLVSEQSR